MASASNFSFLKRADGLYDAFADACLEAEQVCASSPALCAVACRKALELGVQWVYAADDSIRMPYKDNLAALLHEPSFKRCMDWRTWQKLVYIQKLGNVAAHTRQGLRRQDALASLRCLFEFVTWIDYCYGPDYQERAFDEGLVPAPGVQVDAATLAKIRGRLEADQATTRRQADRIKELEDQIRRMAAEAASQRAQAQEAAEAAGTPEPQPAFEPEDMSEWETRQRFIDLDLELAGWRLGPGGNVAAEYPVKGMPVGPDNASGQGFVDYLLMGRDGRPLAVVEAKRTSRDVQAGLKQARLYCDCLEGRFGYRPPFFLTNGYDMLYGSESEAPRPVSGFFSQAELATILDRRGRARPFSAGMVDDAICGRYYQKEAIARACEAFAQGERKALLVMATGTGKTRTAIGLVDVLTKMGQVKNVLFLADRVALVNQAANAFKAHLPQVSRCNLCDKGPRDLSARVVLSTYPSIMNAIDAERDDQDRRVLTPGHFDLVVVDEAHRSIFRKFRAIFDYFDALLVGLTATPAKEVDRNTYRFFDLEEGVPTYLYDYDTAVGKDRVLVPYLPILTHTTFLDEGVTYADLTPEDQERMEEDFADAGEEVPDHVDEGDVDKWLFNQGTVDQVLETLMDYGIRVDGGERLGKTIVFAASQRHARYIVERFGKLYPNLPPGYIQTVLNGDDYASATIADFEVAQKLPAIAVSVDMLDTGVDVPEVVNLVFFKKVRSKIKFWQMIGRGTRLCPGLGVVDPLDGGRRGGPSADKARFFIFDWCRNFEFFGQGGGAEEGRVVASLSERVFARQAQLAFDLQDAACADDQSQAVRAKVVEALAAQVVGLNDDLFTVRQHRAAVERFRAEGAFGCLSAADLACLQGELAPLAHYDEADVDALRFDALIYGLMCALLEGTGALDAYSRRLEGISRRLQRKATIPQVKAQLPLLAHVCEDDFLDGVTVGELERVRLALRGLVKFIDDEGHRPVYTDLSDPMAELVMGRQIHPADDYADYRAKVEHYLADHADSLVVWKLRHNRPLTQADYQELGRILTQELGTAEDYRREFADQPFGLLVRKVAGLDHQAALEAFSDFVSDESLNATQMDFVHRVVDYVERNGYLDPQDLMRAPFDRPRTFVYLFDQTRQVRLVSAVRRVKANAEEPGAA